MRNQGRISIRSLLLTSVLTASVLLGWEKIKSNPIPSFAPLNRYTLGETVAEIIAASPDGKNLAFTNADGQKIGFIDITNPQEPIELGTVDVSYLGEPTAVAITPNGQYALATVRDLTETIAAQKPGTLVFIDLQTRKIAGQVKLKGIGPDNLAITADGSKAIVAIEDEENLDYLPGQRPGSVNFVTINYTNPSQSQVTNLALNLRGIPGVNYPTDPQPEYVAIAKDGQTAAVSLQENNAIAILDVASEQVVRIFSAGTSVHKRADLEKDGKILLNQPFEGRREPDSIAFTADGRYLIAANEGDTNLNSFGDGIYSGGRGWSIFDLQGNPIYDSGSSLEELAVQRGHYPEDRSEKRGIEIEGATTASFGNQEFAFIASERGSFLAVYDISDVKNPRLVNFLPTGLSPEGILAIPQRNLLLTANEKDGTIDFFQAQSAKEFL